MVLGSAAQGAAAAVLVPGGDEQTDEGDRDQPQHDAAEQGFDHRCRKRFVAPFFHDEWRHCDPAPPSVTGPSPSATPTSLESVAAESAAPSGRFRLIQALLLVAVVTGTLLLALIWLPALQSDPYSRATLGLQGSVDNGGRLFRLNCAGCHGLAAQGLVGPNLHGVVRRKNDRQLIQQVVSGRTPPMPRFQPEPQAMADLLAFLHSLPA